VLRRVSSLRVANDLHLLLSVFLIVDGIELSKKPLSFGLSSLSKASLSLPRLFLTKELSLLDQVHMQSLPMMLEDLFQSGPHLLSHEAIEIGLKFISLGRCLRVDSHRLLMLLYGKSKNRFL
jgi:hypothetical protein